MKLVRFVLTVGVASGIRTPFQQLSVVGAEGFVDGTGQDPLHRNLIRQKLFGTFAFRARGFHQNIAKIHGQAVFQ